METSIGARVARTLSAAGGGALAATTSAVARVRPSAKPLHPRGEVWDATLLRHGSPEQTGVPWVDEMGEDHVVVRRSAAVGLPAPWPDIHGLALRVPVSGGYADLLLATTGSGPLTRFLLLPTRVPGRHRLTSLLPYKGPHGPVLFAARAWGVGCFDLEHASSTSDWVPFAELRLVERRQRDLSFDPIEAGPLPGLEHYPWVSLLREPAYRAARRSRAGRRGGPRPLPGHTRAG